MVENFLGAFADLDAEGREENGIAELYENWYGSMFTIITESIEGINKDSASDEVKEQLQQQLCMVLRLIDTVMALSFENDSASALEYFKPFAGTLFELCCSQLCLGSQYDFFVRSMSLGLLTDQIEAKALNPFLLDPANKNIVELIIDTCFKLCSASDDSSEKKSKGEDEDEDEEEAEEDQSTQETSQNLGTQLLDTLTASLVSENGESIAAPIILARSSAVLSKADSTPLDTKAALICLAVLPEAATTFAKTPAYLSSVMAFIQSFANAPHDDVVRSAAYIAMSEHLEHLQPEIATEHATALNGIRQALTDPIKKTSFAVKVKACLPLFIIIRHSSSLADEYLNPSSDKNIIRFLLDQIKPFSTKPVDDLTESDFELLGELIQCVRDFIDANKTPANFEPFVSESFELFLTIAQRSNTDVAFVARTQAATAAAMVASTMSVDALLEKMPTLVPLLTSSMEAEPEIGEGETLPDDVFKARQNINVTWSALANKLGDKIEPFVESHIPFICRALADGYGMSEDDEPEEDEDGMPQQQDSQERDAERSAACECYGDFVTALGPKFLPYQARCFDVISENFKTYGSSVQEMVVEAIRVLPGSLYPTADLKPTPGADIVLPEKLAELLKASKTILLDYSQNATHSGVVEASLDALASFIETYGQVVVNDDAATMKSFEKMIKSILKNDAPCQTMDPNEIAYVDMENGFGVGGFGGFMGEDGEDEEEDEEDEDDDEDGDDEADEEDICKDMNCESTCEKDSCRESSQLMDSVLHILGNLGKAKGAAFKSTLDLFFPKILKLHGKKLYQGAISGFFADLSDAFEESMFEEYRKQILPLLLADLNKADASPQLLRNSAYAIGQIFLKSSGDSMKEYYESACSGFQSAFTAIQKLITDHSTQSGEEFDDLYGARDNVVAGIGRVLMVGAEHVPRATLVPLFISGLPLKNDFSENQAVYSAVAKLVNTLPSTHAGIIEPHYETLIRIFADITVNQGEEQKISEKLKGFILKTARTILASEPALKEKLQEPTKSEFIKLLDAPQAEEKAE